MASKRSNGQAQPGFLSWDPSLNAALAKPFATTNKRARSAPAAPDARLQFNGKRPKEAVVRETGAEKRNREQYLVLRQQKQQAQNEKRREKAAQQMAAAQAAECERWLSFLEVESNPRMQTHINGWMTAWVQHHRQQHPWKSLLDCKDAVTNELRDIRKRIAGEGPFYGVAAGRTGGWSAAQVRELGGKWDATMKMHYAPGFAQLVALTTARIAPPDEVVNGFDELKGKGSYEKDVACPVWYNEGVPVHVDAVVSLITHDVRRLRDARAAGDANSAVDSNASNASSSAAPVRLHKLLAQRPLSTAEQLHKLWTLAHLTETAANAIDGLGEGVLGPRVNVTPAGRVLRGLVLKIADAEHLRAEWRRVVADGRTDDGVSRMLSSITSKYGSSGTTWRADPQLAPFLDAVADDEIPNGVSEMADADDNEADEADATARGTAEVAESVISGEPPPSPSNRMGAVHVQLT
jgi:hypothetical protein